MMSNRGQSYSRVPVEPGQMVAPSGSQPTRHLVDDDEPPIADYDYDPSNNNTCKCRGGRLVGRINIMREDPIPEGQQHKFYPGLRTRIVWVVPSGWPMLFVTCGGIIFIPLMMLLAIDPIAAKWGSIPVVLSMFATLFVLGKLTFKDPGIFPRYSRPMGDKDKWAFCSKTNSYRHAGVTYDSASELLIDRVDHFCPWSGTTIARNNECEFQAFTVCVCHHLLITSAVAVIGLTMKHAPEFFPAAFAWANQTYHTHFD